MSVNDSLLEVYIYENSQLLEQLEGILLTAEKVKSLSDEHVDEIFRVMHTIKGGSAMMSFDSMAKMSHAIEDLFSYVRERRPRSDDWSQIIDIVLSATDFLKNGLAQITSGGQVADSPSTLMDEIKDYVSQLKKRVIEPKAEPKVPEGTAEADLELDARFYRAKVTFEPDCKMENVRAFGIVTSISDLCSRLAHVPEDILGTDSDEQIVINGFLLYMRTDADPEVLKKNIMQTLFLKTLEFAEIPADSPELPKELVDAAPAEPEAAPPAKAAAPDAAKAAAPEAPKAAPAAAAPADLKQSLISVNINKLDKLMNLVGEIVSTETMVIASPDILGLELDNFTKSARLLRKLTDELQDVVMSIRMIPVSSTFHKMNRIVRDMCKKVNKEAELVIIGEETEVDKNIIDHLADPLMHIIRNSMDHGLETAEEREAKGKNPVGRIVLEARNTGGDVIIIQSDDGRGLNRERILKKAAERKMLTKPESEITDKEAFSYVLLPGFSTKDQVSEFSGRGVGMDVVRKNIEKVGGTMSLESAPDKGTTVTIKIPLTLAIMDGMQIRVGNAVYVIPVLSISQSFKVAPGVADIIVDPNGNEMLLKSGECYPIINLSRRYNIPGAVESYTDGIMILVEADNQKACLFADALIGEIQAVVKPVPAFAARNTGRAHDLAGCTIMGDGCISLILNVGSLLSAGQ